MKNFCVAVVMLVSGMFDSLFYEVGEGINKRDPVRILVNGLLVLLLTVGLTLAALLLLGLAARFWPLLIVPGIGIAVKVHYSKKDVEVKRGPEPGISDLERSAKLTRRPLRLCMYTFVNELCKCFPGLIPPFSPESLEYKAMPYSIVNNCIIKHHFLVWKGGCTVPRKELWETLEGIIEQHLHAKDLPMALPEVYVSAEGDSWPGLVVDRVHDLGDKYQVDMVITNEAEAAALKERAASGADSNTPGTLLDDEL